MRTHAQRPKGSATAPVSSGWWSVGGQVPVDSGDDVLGRPLTIQLLR